MYQKLLGRAVDVRTVFDVTEVFRSRVNSVVRLTGMVGAIQMSVAPFNNIKFWLGEGNNIKGQA